MTLLSDWGMGRMMIELAPEVNRAFSARASGVPGILGRCPRLAHEMAPLALSRYSAVFWETPS
jgi:hypothetical protein